MNSTLPIADPPAYPALGRIAGLAVRLLDVPMAGVLLPGGAGSWQLAASRGGPSTLQSEFPAYSDILGDDPLIIIPDLEDDPRFGSLGEVPGNYLRFLAAARFATPEGVRGPGYLCLFDSNPRQLRLQDRRTLMTLAESVAEELAVAERTADRTLLAFPAGGVVPTPPLHFSSEPFAPSAKPGPASPPRAAVAAPVPVAAPAPYGINGLIAIPDKPPEKGSADELERMRLERLIEESSDFIGLAALDGKVDYVNAAGQALLGLDSAEAAKRTRLIDFLMREDRSFFLGTVMPTLMRTGKWEGDSRFRNLKTGATTEVGWSLFLIKDPRTGAATSIATVARDITERKRGEAALRESEERFRHLVEQAGEAFLVYDLTGRIIDANQEACDSLGYPRAELLALSVHHIDITFDPIKGRERWKSMVPGVATTTTGVHRRKDGTSFPVEARVGLFRSGGQRLLLSLARDITERKRNEEALQQARDGLELRVHERTAELALANDDLRGALDGLRQSELRFAHMTANVPGMVYQLLLHEDGTAEFPYVSEGCRELFGLEPAQMRPDACTLLDRIHEDDIGEFLRTLDVSKGSGAAWTWEGRYHAAGDEIRYLQGAARPEKRDGTDTLWDGLLLDITFRKRAEQNLRQSEARNAAILETALDCIVTIDHDGKIVEFNPAAEKTFGGTRADILGKSFNLLVPGLRELATGSLDHPLPTLDRRVELPAYRLDGTLMQVELAVSRITIGEKPMFTAYLRDITQRKADEAALNQAKEEAESANRAKSDFLSRMSHELRTPLNAILGFGQILQMQDLAPAQKDRVGHIVSAGRHLLGLINEVLDIARIEAGRVELSLEPVSVVEILAETLELIRPLTAERNVTLNAPDASHPLHGEHVMADRQRFKQVILNLLSNAVKYNKTGGSVHVELQPSNGEHGLRVCVRDTGMGVPADMLERLFVAFDRLGREHSEIQGTGLGLALSKRLIEAMGGAIGVESVVGVGTTFWMELPRAESQLGRATRLGQVKTGSEDGPQPLTGTHNVLYIEDNLSNLTLIEHLLAERPEIRLMTAMLGRLGLDLALQHRPDLILLDLHLPDLPGWDVLAALQADPSTRDIPVVVVSADATTRQIERLMKAGARAYLTKPLEVDRFHRVLHQFLQKEVLTP